MVAVNASSSSSLYFVTLAAAFACWCKVEGFFDAALTPAPLLGPKLTSLEAFLMFSIS